MNGQRRSTAMGAALLAVAAGLMVAVPVASADTDRGFVTRAGSKLMLDGKPFRFSGVATAAPASAQVPAPAHCAAGDLPETGLQGQVPAADQADGRAAMGYSCNLRLAGASPLSTGDTPFLQTAYLDNCAYMSTVRGNFVDSGFAGSDSFLRGAVVVQDFSNLAAPLTTARLISPAFQNPWESLKGNARRKIIAGVGIQDVSFDLYDASKDCRNPTLTASLKLPNGYGHGGDFSPGGRFYYATDPPSLLGARPQPERVQVIDVSDLAHPRLLLSWVPPHDTYIHDVAISQDGRRAYFVSNGVGEGSPGSSTGIGRNGLLVMDASQIEDGVSDPKISVIGEVHWHDTNGAGQMPALARIGGKPYVIVTDEAGNVNNASTSCPMGTPPGYPRIISLADETHPTIVGTLGLQVDLPENCDRVLNDHLPYTSHYCTVDNPDDATAVACTYWASGLRVFDIRDPAHPREIAYYNPPASPDASLNWSLSAVRFLADKGELWFSNPQHGVQIVRFEPGIYPLQHSAASRSCASRRTVSFRLPTGIRSVQLTINGQHRAAVLRSRPLVLSLRGTPPSTIHVHITGHLHGHSYRRNSVLHPCTHTGA